MFASYFRLTNNAIFHKGFLSKLLNLRLDDLKNSFN